MLSHERSEAETQLCICTGDAGIDFAGAGLSCRGTRLHRLSVCRPSAPCLAADTEHWRFTLNAMTKKTEGKNKLTAPFPPLPPLPDFPLPSCFQSTAQLSLKLLATSTVRALLLPFPSFTRGDPACS